MGCSVSTVDHVKSDTGLTTAAGTSNSCKHSTNWNITKEDIKIIKCTWHILRTDLTGNGLGIFLRIFQISPKTKLLFGLDKDEDTSNIQGNPKIRSHAFRFMQAIGGAVDNIDDIDNAFTGVLLHLGKQHRHFGGFSPEYFDIFYDAMMGQWTAVLNEKFNSEVLDAWGHLFVFIMERLKQGYVKET